jgi:hypothetical protein
MKGRRATHRQLAVGKAATLRRCTGRSSSIRSSGRSRRKKEGTRGGGENGVGSGGVWECVGVFFRQRGVEDTLRQ